ncbi:unnamed protein product [Larinioides sclopetarius]|uniref:Uncharacterized protein n=1 Tax=Larinioides sclopetarius TaxID=280406 RepID=A0AAV2ADB2_9ARAC
MEATPHTINIPKKEILFYTGTSHPYAHSAPLHPRKFYSEYGQEYLLFKQIEFKYWTIFPKQLVSFFLNLNHCKYDSRGEFRNWPPTKLSMELLINI